VLTVNGRVKMVRRWWHSPTSGSIAPVDDAVDARHESVSPGVCEMACRLNNDATNFDGAAANLQRTAQLEMSGEQLRQIVLATGRAVQQAQHSDAIAPAFQATDCKVEPDNPQSPTRIYTGCDGVMVPLVTEAEKQKRRQKVREKRRASTKPLRPLAPRKQGADLAFKEFKTIVFYDEHGRHWHQVLARCGRLKAGARLRREADRLGFAQAAERIANVDGASWIRRQLTEQPKQLPLDGLGLDFYHLSENVHRARRKVFGEEAAEGKAWAAELLHVLKHEGYDAAWQRCVAWRATLRGRIKPQAADRLLNYMAERRDMIQYPQFARRGWQIGSGPTESRCKTSTSRLKGRGRRWNAANAEAVAALTTLKDSGQWRLYWPTPSPIVT
jgi:hypothetical protein